MISNEARLRAIEKRLEHLRTFNVGKGSSGGGRPYATVVVAAVDSQSADSSNANFVCNGVADEETISEALVTGSRVLLLDGHYNLSAPILAIANFELDGMGVGVTYLNCDVDYHFWIEDISHITIRDCSLTGDGSGIWLDTATDVSILRNEFDNLAVALTFTGVANCSVIGNRFTGCGIVVT